ncbi:MAG TPA: CRISPR-associated endonuclease Cas1 [Streptosporangiaceae bacterium]|nr:CRISPR-associated endonuclease Cas1 [Streptosporangiaceae bacterium]
MTITEVPELVPARMLNEYAYCPRLFFLEWVDSLWASNADIAEGNWRHQRADAGGGAAPLPGEGELKAAWSVELSSETLGITAKLDLIEASDGGVVPVDTKKGRPTPDGTPWEADAVQVCAQVLLLRERGYAVDRGEIFYAQTRQRVPVEPTPELIARTMEIAAEARAAAARLAPPPPLRSSPKCPRCSLVGICLPDETNVLAKRNDGRPRRLIAADPDAAPLYVTEPGAMIGVDGGRLTVSKHREQLASVRLIDVLHVCAFGNVQVSAQAMRALFQRDIDVFHFSYGGWLLGMTTGLPSKNVMLRIRQATAAARGQLDEPRRMISGKIRNCRVLLRRNGGEPVARTVGRLAALASQAERAADAAGLLGIEGTAARLYFEAFPAMLRWAADLPGPAFGGLRNRRPPTDAVNCLLSFCYALLTKEVVAACLHVGFDPYIGLFHRPRFGRPALALDLAEEFRPLLADSTVLTLVNNREIGASHFLVRAGAVTLTAEGRKAVIRAWERRMTTELRHPAFGYKVSYRRALELQARVLAARLAGELPSYEPLVMR